MNEEKKDRPKLDLSLPKETNEQRAKEAEITEAYMIAARNYVEDMKAMGIYKIGDKTGRVSPAQVRKLFNSGSE